jgi:hypothetical protein
MMHTHHDLTVLAKGTKPVIIKGLCNKKIVYFKEIVQKKWMRITHLYGFA